MDARRVPEPVTARLSASQSAVHCQTFPGDTWRLREQIFDQHAFRLMPPKKIPGRLRRPKTGRIKVKEKKNKGN
jgi:hypothetical protein